MMRSATVLGEFPTCSRRASTSLLRSSACQPGRSGRLPRVVPATAPPSSPFPSSSLAPGGAATTTDALPQPRANANATQVVAQSQPAPPQKLQAAAPAALPQPLTAPSVPSSPIPSPPAPSATPPSTPAAPSASLPSGSPPSAPAAQPHPNLTQDSTGPSATTTAPSSCPTSPTTPAPLSTPESPAATITPHPPPSPSPPSTTTTSPASSPAQNGPQPSLDVDPNVPSAARVDDLDGNADSTSGAPDSPHGDNDTRLESANTQTTQSSSSTAPPAAVSGSSSTHGHPSAGAQQQQRLSSSSVSVPPTPSGSHPSGAPSPSSSLPANTEGLCDSRDEDTLIPAGSGSHGAAAGGGGATAATATDGDPARSSSSAPPGGSFSPSPPSSSAATGTSPVSEPEAPHSPAPAAMTTPSPPSPSPTSVSVAGSGGAASPQSGNGAEDSGGGEGPSPHPPPLPLAAATFSAMTTPGAAAPAPSGTSSASSSHPSPPSSSGTASTAAATATGSSHREPPTDLTSPAAANGTSYSTGAATQSGTKMDGSALSTAAGAQVTTSPNPTPSPTVTTTSSAAAAASNGPSPHTTATPHAHSTPSPLPHPHTGATPITAASSGFQLRPMHVVIFAAIFLGGALFAAFTLQFTADLDFQAAATTVARRVARSVAFRQLCVIACAICLVRFGLNNVLRALARFSANPVQWDKSKVYYILKEVYQPLELLLFIAAICTIADSFVPQLIAVPRTTVSTVVRSTLSVSFIIGAATVVFNLKSRFCKENAWQSEMNGDVTAQRRWEAYDKLGTFVIYAITFVLGIQALGLEVTSVLAIGGIGGLAIGLAGREICENILNGFLIMSTSPFEVGDEVHFFHSNKVVEGIVLDIGWYRTTIRSYEREVFVIPNAVFSKNIVLNITRKNREWRFFEMICVRVQDVHKVNAIIQDIRRIVRNDQRIITKLHRRIFLDKLTHEDCRIYVSFYVEAQNRESFMAAKQDLLLAFVDCVERNGAKLAVPRTTVQMEPDMAESLSPLLGAAAAMAAAKVTMDVQAAAAAGNAAAAAARALTDGRTITAEVTTVPSSPSPLAASSSQSATGTTNGNGNGSAAMGSSSKTGAGNGGSSGSSQTGGGGGGSPSGKSSGGGVTSEVAVVTSVGVGAAAVTQQGSQKGSESGGTGVTWILSKLAQMLFET